ncbi:MAG: T9SS type A sorting domain-containing protein [Flavobacteriales bacterium]|nr:T9SS type A sorting domain-containing protein [Flavobacteriales bacterium]MCB9193372.1 T9SS type A sorting domain-containing protein [Flavobacteriales bacterium]
MKGLLLLTLTGTSLPLFAQLAPQQDAPLARHLLEVNAQWAVRDPEPEGGKQNVHFANDAERIAAHLHRVRAYLYTHTPEGLSATQLQQRTQLLNDLERYADRGLFPQNEVLPFRNPVFIDPRHTACAVGQLMIESGDRALAERISGAMNLAYVSEILADPRFTSDVAAWATTHGFTAEDLAWIQPAYAPPTLWTDMGGGTDTTVTCLLNDGQGNLYLAGTFTQAGGAAMNGVARWAGGQYLAMGTGINGTPKDMVIVGQDLLVAGQFQGGLSDLARWNGLGWSYETVELGMDPHLNDLFVMNGELYVAGNASGFAGITHQVMHWNGAVWEPVGDPLNDVIHTLGQHDGRLVAAGAFTEIGQFGGTPCAHVAELVNGQWQQLADGLPDEVFALHDRNGMLMAGGMLFDGTNNGFGLSLLPAGGSQWNAPLYANWSSLGNNSAVPSAVLGFGEHDGTVYFCGNFNAYGPGLNDSGTQIARFLDGTQDVEGLAWVNGDRVHAVASFDGRLVIGGTFSGTNATLANNIATSDLGLGVAGTDAWGADLAVAPNPAVDKITVQRDQEGRAHVEVVDAAGRTVIPARTFTGRTARLDISDLPAGTYWLRLTGENGITARPLVKR